jgi:hypothetical protein
MDTLPKPRLAASGVNYAPITTFGLHLVGVSLMINTKGALYSDRSWAIFGVGS